MWMLLFILLAIVVAFMLLSGKTPTLFGDIQNLREKYPEHAQ